MKLSITFGKGFHAIMDNGITLSVQIGGGNYCDNRNQPIKALIDTSGLLPACANAEIAVWANDGDMLTLANGYEVAGYVPIKDIFLAIPQLLALPAPADTKSVLAIINSLLQEKA